MAIDIAQKLNSKEHSKKFCVYWIWLTSKKYQTSYWSMMAPQASLLNPLSNNQQKEFFDHLLDVLLTNKDSFASIYRPFLENHDKWIGISIFEEDTRNEDS